MPLLGHEYRRLTNDPAAGQLHDDCNPKRRHILEMNLRVYENFSNLVVIHIASITSCSQLLSRKARISTKTSNSKIMHYFDALTVASRRQCVQSHLKEFNKEKLDALSFRIRI